MDVQLHREIKGVMDSSKKTEITVTASILAPLEQVWTRWTSPDDIVHWNQASEDWHTTRAENDLRVGGKFSYRMEAKDGSFGFDFWGIYDQVKPNQVLESTLGDGRNLKVEFSEVGDHTLVTETFEAETSNPVELQQNGWQSILNNFKFYVESLK